MRQKEARDSQHGQENSKKDDIQKEIATPESLPMLSKLLLLLALLLHERKTTGRLDMLELGALIEASGRQWPTMHAERVFRIVGSQIRGTIVQIFLAHSDGSQLTSNKEDGVSARIYVGFGSGRGGLGPMETERNKPTDTPRDFGTFQSPVSIERV